MFQFNFSFPLFCVKTSKITTELQRHYSMIKIWLTSATKKWTDLKILYIAREFIIFSSVFCAMFASSSHELTVFLLALRQDKCREGTVGNWVLSTENLSERIQQLTLELTSPNSESHCLAPSKSCASAPMGRSPRGGTREPPPWKTVSMY